MTVDYTFSNVGGRGRRTPAQVWTTFTSKRFKYSIALPSDWEAEQSKGRKKPDDLLSADDRRVRHPLPDQAPRSTSGTSGYVDDLKRTKTKAKVTSNKAATVDGLRARRVEWSRDVRRDERLGISTPSSSAASTSTTSATPPSRRRRRRDRTFVESLIASMGVQSPPGEPSSQPGDEALDDGHDPLHPQGVLGAARVEPVVGDERPIGGRPGARGRTCRRRRSHARPRAAPSSRWRPRSRRAAGEDRRSRDRPA